MKSPHDTESRRFLPTPLDQPDPPFRFMRRRRFDRRDRGDHPLGGLALVFPLAIAFALALTLATLTGLGLQDLLAADTFTLVANPGSENMRIVAKRDGEIQQFSLDGRSPVQGVGVLVGSFYRLADGSVVWVPESGAAPVTPGVPPLATPTPVATPAADPLVPGSLEGSTPLPTLLPESATPSPSASNAAPPQHLR